MLQEDAATGRPLTQPLHHIEQPVAAAFMPDGTNFCRTMYGSCSCS